MRHVVLPQAVRRVVPPLLNDFVSLQKDTALVGAVGVFEALYAELHRLSRRELARHGDVGAEFAARAEEHDLLATLDPASFLGNPYLWVGLAVAAGFVAAAVWMRRYREPI